MDHEGRLPRNQDRQSAIIDRAATRPPRLYDGTNLHPHLYLLDNPVSIGSIGKICVKFLRSR